MSAGSGEGPNPYAVLAIVALSVLALVGGELIGSVIRGEEITLTGDDVPQLLPAPVPTATSFETGASPDPEASDLVMPADIVAPRRRAFIDSFVLVTHVCAAEPEGSECGMGANATEGTVWVLLTFENGEETDRLAVTVLAGGDDAIGGGELVLSELGCEGVCDGSTYVELADLPPGPYRVNVSRNEEPAGSIPFRVEP